MTTTTFLFGFLTVWVSQIFYYLFFKVFGKNKKEVWVIKVHYFEFGSKSFCCYPFIVLNGSHFGMYGENLRKLVQHEYTHFLQQKECGFLFTYLVYIFEMILKLSYKNISFEREASYFESLSYEDCDFQLSHRKKFNFLKFMFKNEEKSFE